MNSIKIYSRAGLIICKPNKGPIQIFEAGANVTATNNSVFSDGVDITDAVQSSVVFSGVPYQRIFQEDGSSYGGSRSAVVTALTTLFATRDVDDFLVKDDSAGLTGTTKIRHKADASGTADRNQGGTLELDTHSASIGLYDSFLKINETDLSNTGGKTQAYGNFLLNLNNLTGTVNCMTIGMGNLYQKAVGTFNFATLDISGNVTFSSAADTVTFSGNTSGINYNDLSNTPATVTNTNIANTNLTLDAARTLNLSGNDLDIQTGGTSKLLYDVSANQGSGEWLFGARARFMQPVEFHATGGTSQSQIRFREPPLGGSSSVILKGPATNLASDLTFVLPDADGSAGQFLKTDGSGNLSFASAGGGSTSYVLASHSARASMYYPNRYYYGSSAYGWATDSSISYAQTSATSLNDQYAHMGIVAPTAITNLALKATVRNDSSSDDVELYVFRGSRPNGSENSISLTQLFYVSSGTDSDQDLHFSADASTSSAGISAGDLVFLALKRGGSNGTKYVNISYTLFVS
jgi:hypothetical protein